MHQPPSADLPDRLHAQHPDSPAPPSQAGYGVVNFRCRSPPNLVNIDWFGCGQVVSGAGFLLNNTMDDFSSKPGSPNIFGVVGGDANGIAADKRPLSTMTPTILTLHDRVAVLIGTLGGGRHRDLDLPGLDQLARLPHAPRGCRRRAPHSPSAAAARHAL